MAKNKAGFISGPNEASQLVTLICKKHGVTVSQISADTRFAVAYIEEQMSENTLVPNRWFLKSLAEFYGEPYSDEITKRAKRPKPAEKSEISSAAHDSLAGCSFAQRSVLWFLGTSLLFFASADCKSVLKIIDSCAENEPTVCDDTPYAALCREIGAVPGAAPDAAAMMDAASRAGLPHFLCRGMSHLAEISADEMPFHYPVQVVTEEQANLLYHVRVSLRTLNDDALNKILAVVFDTIDSGVRNNKDKKVRFPVRSAAEDYNGSPFSMYLNYLYRKESGGQPLTIDKVSSITGMNTVAVSHIMKGRDSVPYRYLPYFFESFHMDPLQQELAKYFAFMSRRFLMFDTLSLDIDARQTMLTLQNAVPYLSREHLDEIGRICHNAVSSRADDAALLF